MRLGPVGGDLLERDDQQLDVDLVFEADLGRDAVGGDAKIVAIHVSCGATAVPRQTR